MKYFVEIEGRSVEVDLCEEGAELVARIDGRRFVIDECDVDRLGQYSNLVNHASYAISLEQERDKFRVEIGGDGFSVVCEDERERTARELEGAHPGAGGVVESIMPGIVLKIEVEVGSQVEADSTLLILEAMKMQNEIKAEHVGVVKQIFVAEGDAVGAGEKLVEIETPQAE